MSGLAILDFSITSTSSGKIDGHFPDGNDSTGGVPLVWANVIGPFMQKQEGTPFSVNLFSAYLTQPGGATASLSPGSSLGSGWTLNSSGVLAFSGTGIATGNIQVRATYTSGPTTWNVDSPIFTYESIAHVVGSDTQAPTVPTGLTMLSRTTTTITVSVDSPSDVPSGVPSSGMKEVHFTQGGVDKGVFAMAAGLGVTLLRKDYGTGGATQRLFAGHRVHLQENQMNTPTPGNGTYVGIPNGGSLAPVGPFSTGVSALVIRYEWGEIDNGDGTYNFTQRMDGEIAQCAARGVGLYALIIVRTFQTTVTHNFTGSVGGATSGTLTVAATNGTYGVAFSNGETRNNVVVTGGTHAAWTPALKAGSVTTGEWLFVKNNPLPSNLIPYSEVYTSGGGGWQTWRWDPHVLTAWDNLCKAIGTRYDSNTAFAGISTQETAGTVSSTNGNGYTQTAFRDALIAESNSIFKYNPSSRHQYYFNFMSGNSATAKTNLQTVADTIAPNGAWLGGPDLVMKAGSGIFNRCYPIYGTYKGPIFCSVQPDEWTGANPPGVADLRTMRDLFDYGQGLIANADGGKPFASTSTTKPLNAINWDWHTSANGNGEQYNPTLSGATVGAHTGLFKDTSAVYATFTPTAGGGVTPGTLTKSGVDYDILGFGDGIGATADSWSAGSVGINGSCAIIAKLSSVSGSDTSAAVAGISFRATQAADSPVVHVVVTPTQIRARYRPTSGAAMSTIASFAGTYSSAKWLKIVRISGTNSFTCYYSADDHSWVNMGNVTLAMAPNIFAEVFCSSGGAATSCTAHFQQVNIQTVFGSTGNYDPTFTPGSGDYYYVDLNASVNGNGLTAATPKNVLPSSTVTGMQLLFNSDNGVQRIVSTSGAPVENAFNLDGTNVQISSYGTGRAVVSGFQPISGSWTASGGSGVYKKTLTPPLDGGSRDIVGCVVNTSDTSASPQGTVLTWIDARTVTFTGGTTVNNIPAGSSCYDYTGHVMYVHLAGGVAPASNQIAYSGVSRMLTVAAGHSPSKFTFHNLRVIGFARAGANFVQGANLGRVYDNQLYGQGYMFVTTEYFGSGFQFSQTANNIECFNNLIEETGDSPFTPQHFGAATGGAIHDIYMHHNTISKWGLSCCEMSDFGTNVGDNTTSQITFEYNRCTGGGGGYSQGGHEVFTDGPHLRGKGTWTDIVIQHNTIQTRTTGTNSACVSLHAGSPSGVTGNPVIVFDNRMSSSQVGFYNQSPTNLHANVTGNQFCNNGTDLNPSTPGSGNSYGPPNNTTQVGECYITPRTTEGIQPAAAGVPTFTFTGLTTLTSYNLAAFSRDLSSNDSASCSTVAVSTT